MSVLAETPESSLAQRTVDAARRLRAAMARHTPSITPSQRLKVSRPSGFDIDDGRATLWAVSPNPTPVEGASTSWVYHRLIRETDGSLSYSTVNFSSHLDALSDWTRHMSRVAGIERHFVDGLRHFGFMGLSPHLAAPHVAMAMLGVKRMPMASYFVRRHLALPVARFRQLLDPKALAFVENLPSLFPPDVVEFLDGRHWSGLDAIATPGAPLRASVLASAPECAPFLFELWDADCRGFRAPALDVLDEAIHRAGATSEKVVFAQSAPFPITAPSNIGLGVTAALVLARLPYDWRPKGEDEWKTLLDLARALHRSFSIVAGAVPDAALLSVKGRWTSFAEQIARQLDCGIDETPQRLSTALDGVRDFVDSFSRQVLQAARLAQGEPPASVRADAATINKAARALLLGGRSLPRILEESALWHSRLHEMQSLIVSTSMGAVAWSWKPCLPDWSDEDYDFVVLKSEAELADEGRKGRNQDGSLGLDHCAVTYGRACMEGRSRIVSLRRRLPGGGFERLSTAQVDLKHLTVVQHRSAGNLKPAPVCHTAILKYVYALGETLPVDLAGAAFTPDDEQKERLAHTGYDYAFPGAFEASADAWSPFLPRPVRGWDIGAFAAFARSEAPVEHLVRVSRLSVSLAD